MSETVAYPTVTPADRLTLTLCFALVVHAIVILGVSFAPPDRTAPRYDSLDVILVQQRSARGPDEADFLAQANLVGGGESERNLRPATPLAAPFPERRADVAAAPPPGTVSRLEQAVKAMTKERRVKREVAEKNAPKQQRKVLVAEAKSNHKAVAESAKKSQAVQEPSTTAPPANATMLISRSLAMASLNAELAQRLEARAKRPKRKFISATTTEYRYAAYMEAWRTKVERVGNLNYPEEARRNKLAGSLILDVALRADGSVFDIAVRRPSGFKVLDDAAIRIVNLAQPFAPFPDNISGEVDILHITRSWQFMHNHRLSSN
ncbi:MAG: TonB family protein [Pseudomonadota bacterium]|nr:TonB family protein [Pseudomonadota bacterium]